MPKLTSIKRSFNAGELDEKMDSRSDQEKYTAGCKTLENFIPLIYGSAQRRSGLEFINAAKSSTAANKSRLVSFEHSVDDTYILEFANQSIRFFRNGALITTGSGAQDLSSMNNIVAHWLMNDNLSTQVVLDDDGNTHNGTTVTNNTEDLTATAKTGTGSLLFAGRDAVVVSDSNDFSFDDTSNEPFSIVGWCNVTDVGVNQTIISKWQSGTAREWKLSIDRDKKLRLDLFDDSTGLNNDIVAQWKLNESAGDTAVDNAEGTAALDGVASANTNTLSAAGKISNAFDFSGTASVAVSDNAALSFDDSGSNPFSIAAWVYVTENNFGQHILAKYDDGVALDREWQFFLDSTLRFNFGLYDEANNATAFVRTIASLSTNQWHFVCGTYDSSGGASAANGITLYVDGEAIASGDTFIFTAATYSSMVAGATDVIIGARRDGAGVEANFNDKIDNVTLFGKELFGGDVTDLYNSGFGTEELDGARPFAVTDSALSNGWNFVSATYSAADGGGTTAASDIILYVNGSAVDITATEDALYTAMENTAANVYIASVLDSASAIQEVWQERMDNLAVFSDIVASSEVTILYSSAILSVESPYLTKDLFGLRFENSADVMFITHPSYESRRLSRFSNTDWRLTLEALQTGPFRSQNTDTTKTITASATTGTVTLTATGHTPFITGTTAGHEPSGVLPTSKSQTGALYKLVHAMKATDATISHSFTGNESSAEVLVVKGTVWDLITDGSWVGTMRLEREYGNSGVWETVHPVINLSARNIVTSGTEETADAQYRVTMSGFSSGPAEVQFSIRDTSHIGIVQITSVTSSTVATGTVIETLADITATHRWSEGSFSNRRGWPIDVTISSEERLTFSGNISEPLTIWGSAIGDFTDFKEGTDDDDAIQFTLVGSGQQNRIRWMVAKEALVLGTVGGEHLLGASKDEEALTPTNVKAKLQTTYGSENIAAKMVNQAILFVQRGGKKIREFLYNFEADAHKADDLTVFAGQVTGDGIVDMAFQRTPDPILWCVRTDGQLAIMNYERDQNVFSWARIFTTDSTANSVIESVAVKYGGTRSEDEVWVSILRQINSSDSRTIERFTQRELPSSASNWKFLDSYYTYTGATTTATGGSHLIGEAVQVLGDGVVQTEATAGDFTVDGSGEITLPAIFTTVQIGLGYTSTLVPMDIDLEGLGLAVTTRINKTYVNVHDTVGVKIGPDTSHLKDVVTGTDKVTDFRAVSIPGGYARDTTVTVQQTKPLPATILSLTHDIGGSKD